MPDIPDQLSNMTRPYSESRKQDMMLREDIVTRTVSLHAGICFCWAGLQYYKNRLYAEDG